MFLKDRIQIKNPITKQWVLIDTFKGKILDHGKDGKPFKNVRKVTHKRNNKYATNK